MNATTMVAIIMATTIMLFSTVSSANITVGGSNGWNISTSIYVNDTLQFIYTQPSDVIEVSEPDFTTCNTSNPITVYKNINNGEILINLTKPGPRYFVSGRFNNCTLGLKLHVQVLDIPMLQPNSLSPNDRANQLHNIKIDIMLRGVLMFLFFIFLVIVIAPVSPLLKAFYLTLGCVGYMMILIPLFILDIFG